MNAAIEEFYRGKDVFVTGHTGFKGSWLCLWLTKLGARIHGYSLPAPTEPSLFVDAKVQSCLASHTIGDVRDPARLEQAMAAASPSMVFHLAAQPLVRRSYEEPRETFAANVMGTVNLLDAVRRCPGVRVCQVVTTDKCYENREWVYPYRECDRLGGHDPYSASKACAELVVASYRKAFFTVMADRTVSIASARAGNVIGGGDWAKDRIIPDCVRALERGEEIAVRNPTATRPFQHVLEPLSGYLALGSYQWQHPEGFSDAYNFGPATSDCITVGELVSQVTQTWGTGTWKYQAQQHAAHEAHLLQLDTSKAAATLNWRPRWDVALAVKETIEWYRQRHQGGDMQGYCLGQIRKYESAGNSEVCNG